MEDSGVTVPGDDELLQFDDTSIEGRDERVERGAGILRIHNFPVPSQLLRVHRRNRERRHLPTSTIASPLALTANPAFLKARTALRGKSGTAAALLRWDIVLIQWTLQCGPHKSDGPGRPNWPRTKNKLHGRDGRSWSPKTSPIFTVYLSGSTKRSTRWDLRIFGLASHLHRQMVLGWDPDVRPFQDTLPRPVVAISHCRRCFHRASK